MIELKNISKGNDSEYFYRIMEEYQFHKDKEELEIWRYLVITNAMKGLRYEDNEDMIKNGLILIMALYKNITPDSYNTHGTKFAKLEKNDKEICVEILKKEMLGN